MSVGATLGRARVLSHVGSTALTLMAIILDRLTQGIAERLKSPPTRWSNPPGRNCYAGTWNVSLAVEVPPALLSVYSIVHSRGPGSAGVNS
jgi:hypothetical protein